MSNYRKHIDRLFKEKLGNYRETPPPDVWDTLETRLDGLTPAPSGFPFRWIAHIVIISAIVILGVVVSKEKMSNSDLSVEDLGAELGLGRVQLYRKTKSLTGYAPNELLRIARLKKAASLLASSEKTVAEITYEVGFSSPSYFTRCYKDYFGESPSEFLKRRDGKN